MSRAILIDQVMGAHRPSMAAAADVLAIEAVPFAQRCEAVSTLDAIRIGASHNPQGPVSTAASLEFGFSQPSYAICETVTEDVPWRRDVVSEGFTIEPKGRIVKPNTRPGLGITINEAEVRKHPFEQEVLQRVFYPDGSVGDW